MDEGKNDTIKINGKTIAVIVILLLLLFGTIGMFALKNSHNENSVAGNTQINEQYENMPEKCRPPAGQDIASWKEHLGHHAETRNCLQYFE